MMRWTASGWGSWGSGSSARTDLRGGPLARAVPTATDIRRGAGKVKGTGRAVTGLVTATLNVTSYPDTGLAAGTTYYYRVRAWNDAPSRRIHDAVPALRMDGSGAVERYGHHHSDFENTTGKTGRYASRDEDHDYLSGPSGAVARRQALPLRQRLAVPGRQ